LRYSAATASNSILHSQFSISPSPLTPESCSRRCGEPAEPPATQHPPPNTISGEPVEPPPPCIEMAPRLEDAYPR
jgi:hypothetical protein